MLNNNEIIVISDEWGRYPFSCQHIMKHMIANNRVIWVAPTGMRNPRFTFSDVKRIFEKLKKMIGNKAPVKSSHSDQPYQIIPFALPYNDNKTVRAINNGIVKSKVRSVLENGRKRIVITTLPIAAEYIDAFEADVVVYYIVDDFTEWPGGNREYMTTLEELLIRKSDVLMASASKLCDIKTRTMRPVLIPHGVDVDHFSPCIANSAEFNDFPHCQKPIIGFFGAISPWLDFNLLAAAASAHPEWSFVFIGPVDADIRQLEGLSNVYFHGKVLYSDLPRYAHQFDIGIIPFQINELTVSVNPLKLLEYFACGLPVVSTALPEVFRFSNMMCVARSTEEFINGLEKAMVGLTIGKEERIQAAEDNSWRSVAERFSNVIDEYLNRTSH